MLIPLLHMCVLCVLLRDIRCPWQVDAKRIYREMFILRHMRNDEIIHLRDVIMPPPAYDDFRDLYLVSVPLALRPHLFAVGTLPCLALPCLVVLYGLARLTLPGAAKPVTLSLPS